MDETPLKWPPEWQDLLCKYKGLNHYLHYLGAPHYSYSMICPKTRFELVRPLYYTAGPSSSHLCGSLAWETYREPRTVVQGFLKVSVCQGT